MYRLKMRTPGGRQFRSLSRWGVIAFAVSLFLTRVAPAAPVTADTATSAVQGWLHQDRRPLGRELPGKIKSTQAVKNAAGEVLYYVVHLDPAGFVILPADDQADPIIAFSATGKFDASSGSGTAALVNHDLPKRMARARSRAAGASKSRGKWHAFLAGSPNPPPDVEENGNIVVASQIWVAPFVQTLWNQSTDISLQDACYNYFTPPYGTGVVSNYPCGCVATALAQEMYYFQYPNTGVGTASFTITNNGASQTAHLRGGDGAGGPYQWNQMLLAPTNATTNQAGAMGALTYDAGVAINMAYSAELSFAYTYVAQQALTNTFKFANAAYYEDDLNGSISGQNLVDMINPNLDARLPVIIGIEPDGGHCALCDGYGYSASTLFHHLNMGYAGDDDIWYALPSVDTVDAGDFTTVVACIYNIYTNSSSGQIISGRVTDPTGAPVAGATVTAARSGGGSYMATTDANGIYALARIPAASTYALTVTKTGNSSANGNFSTGTSVYLQLPSGNVWGANFVLSPPLLAVPENGFATIGPVGGPFSVVSQSYNLTNTSASSINWALSNTNAWLSVTATNGTVAAGAFSILTVSVNTNANTNAAGAYAGSIWITNLTSGLAQQLAFSLSVKTADYPIAVTGYNLDVVVENNAVGGDTTNYAATFDPVCAYLTSPNPVCFYEAGLVATNLLTTGMAALGLPHGGLFTNENDHATTYQFGPYNSSNVLYLTSSASSASLTLSTPAAYKSLSVLAGSALGGGTGTLVIHFADGSSSSAINFNATNYITTNNPSANWAITNSGLLIVGDYNVFNTVDSTTFFPTLYQTAINLHALGLDTNLITSVTFTRPPNGGNVSASTVTGVFALSGTEAAFTGNYLLTVSASPANGGTVGGGGSFAAGSSTTVTATPGSNYVFANWTQGGIVVSTSPSYTNTINSDETLVANFLQAFTLTVNALPANGGTVSGAGTFLAGSTSNLVTATPASGFEFIGWTGDATGTNPQLAETMTTNINVTANFAAIGSNISLTVIVTGNGTVTPNLNGETLKAGRNYTLTAKATSGNVFSNWTGSITTNKNPLTIKAESAMVLQANFIPNPFLAVKGTYNGLFSATNGVVTEQTAGMVKNLAISTKGTYTGALLINGTTHGISGSFDLAGQATNKIVRPAAQGGPLLLEMSLLTSTNAAPQVTGTVFGTNAGIAWTATNLTANLSTNTLPSA